MKLSIIIPHHNQPDLLKIMLDSIKADPQTQIIVVDDNSDQYLDAYAVLTKDPAYRKVLFLKSPADQRGPGCARNIGIENANGTYLMFCDADDYLVDDYDRKIAPYLDSEIDMVYFTPISRILGTMQDAHRVDKYIKLIEDHLKNPSQKTEDALRYIFYINPSKLIKRSMVEEHHIRFDELMVSEDVMFATYTGHYAKTLAATADVIYCATRSPHSLTMTQTKSTYDTRFSVILRQHDFVRKALGEKRYKRLDMPSLVFIANAFTYHLGIGTAFSSAITMVRHHIPILRLNQFKPTRILSFLRYNNKAQRTHSKS